LGIIEGKEAVTRIFYGLNGETLEISEAEADFINELNEYQLAILEDLRINDFFFALKNIDTVRGLNPGNRGLLTAIHNKKRGDIAQIVANEIDSTPPQNEFLEYERILGNRFLSNKENWIKYRGLCAEIGKHLHKAIEFRATQINANILNGENLLNSLKNYVNVLKV